MSWSMAGRLIDWLVPCIFALVLGAFVPLGTTFEFGADEGFEFMKGLLVSRGHPIYGGFWNDQPPLHTELLAVCFRLFGPSALVGRFLSVGFATLLVASLYHAARMRSGRATGFIAVALLTASPWFLQLSASVMLEMPAMAVAMASVCTWFRYVERRHPKWVLLSGALFGCALQVKFTAIVYLPAMALDGIVFWRDPVPEQPPRAERASGQGSGGAQPALYWFGAATGIFLLIVWLCYPLGTLGIFFDSHFSSRTAEAVSGGRYAFRPGAMMLDCWSLAVPAAAGIVVIALQRRLDLLFPVALALTVAAIHLLHHPFWYYYQLHFSIPMAWLGGVAVVQSVRIRREPQLAASLWRKCGCGAGLLAWAAVTSLVVTSAPVEWWDGVTSLRAAVPVRESPTVSALKRRAAGARWIFTNERSAAFWAGLAIPPELAVIPFKRIWSGQITTDEILRSLEKRRPELVLISADWEARFGLTEYLKENYREDGETGAARLLIRK